ncbi:ribosomal RNA small subunit methyltransferase F [Cohnella xylanilytica]|uniref:RsmB/NOP family class I SAM-dependent RNA methyltransferase n=1 Tax=Cohnella xylanilytica TaxID=557555 RepID=UPI001B12F500|nr:RsmB/NOP family class I SAM-dependent RNA methyltransferase [Cohnella xylanilytica]GIO16662.1 ribosomal RNA small subunit methyltransferase F [Cohnella xylanilytica]
MVQLPAAYAERIRQQLGGEADAFLASYEKPRAYGLRLNPLKIAAEAPLFAALRERFSLEPVPWCEHGYFYDEATRPGRHPWHAAGLYYIQEPSAMIAAELLDPRPGEIVLDLAAAPGGKTTQIAGRMAGRGLLVANEIHAGRAKILAENVERMGIPNAVVANAAPDELSARWPEAFDRIMLDAPCSGEGMFRKDPDAMGEWSPEAVETCAARQRSILPDAARMLKPGGRLVYSTCTFNREENEETIAWFLSRHPEFTLIREERMWPHRNEGEGHYAAVLEKSADASAVPAPASPPRGRSKSRDAGRPASPAVAAARLFREFAADALPGFELPAEGEPLLFGDALYWLPSPEGSPLSASSMKGLKLPRPGLHLGDVRKGRFEPGHALAMAAKASAAANACDYPADGPETAAYLRGESLPAREGSPKGWGLFTADGYPLGWFKTSDGQHKNRLPKGLRLFSDPSRA